MSADRPDRPGAAGDYLLNYIHIFQGVLFVHMGKSRQAGRVVNEYQDGKRGGRGIRAARFRGLDSAGLKLFRQPIQLIRGDTARSAVQVQQIKRTRGVARVSRMGRTQTRLCGVQ